MKESLIQLTRWLADRAVERSTWQGVAIIASVFGVNLHGDLIASLINQFGDILIGAGVICGANSVLKQEKPKN